MLAFDTESGRALLENHSLPEGAFVVTTSGLDFANLCVLKKVRLTGIVGSRHMSALCIPFSLIFACFVLMRSAPRGSYCT